MSEDVASTLQDRLDDIEKDFNNTWEFHTRVIENLHMQMDREQRPSWNPIRLWRRRKARHRLRIQYSLEQTLMKRLGNLWYCFDRAVKGSIKDDDAIGFLQWCRWYEYRRTVIDQGYTDALREIGK